MTPRKLALLLVVTGASLGFGAAPAHAAKALPKPVYAGTCGLPNRTPLWIEFGWPAFAGIFGRPGVIVSASSGDFPAQMRATGAKTVYWDMHLKERVGQPATPADPATVVAKADKLYDYAAAQIGCSTPVIVENELFGAGLVPPWSDANATYRQNVLTFLRELAARGAYPVLLVNSDPYTAGDAGVWWQEVAGVSDILREAYIPATILYKAGPVLGNRMLRTAYRSDVEQFTSLGIPPHRIGLITTMSTTVGFGGRNGLKPASAWYDVVKWQALSLRQVAAETGIGSLWSWGWGEWTTPEKDPAKLGAACVWLWTRSPSLCNGLAVAGAGFEPSRTEGQIRLGSGVQCVVGRTRLSNDAVQRLQLVTGDRDAALTALYSRLAESSAVHVPVRQAAVAERAIVAERFGGSWRAYGAALSAAHASRAIALGVLGDELRRAKIEAGLRVGNASSAAVLTYYQSYPATLARRVQASAPAPWLGNRKVGFALSALAPASLFDLPLGRPSSLRTPLGTYKVKPLGATTPLGALPLGLVRPAIAATLASFERGAAYEHWTRGLQSRQLDTAICARDDLPAPGSVDLSTYLPFLALYG